MEGDGLEIKEGRKKGASSRSFGFRRESDWMDGSGPKARFSSDSSFEDSWRNHYLLLIEMLYNDVTSWQQEMALTRRRGG